MVAIRNYTRLTIELDSIRKWKVLKVVYSILLGYRTLLCFVFGLLYAIVVRIFGTFCCTCCESRIRVDGMCRLSERISLSSSLEK